MIRVLRYFLPMLLLFPAVVAAGQGALQPSKTKQPVRKETIHEAHDSLREKANLESVIPQKASFKEPLKQRKAVVIVPAPPPPPGPDPIPPKNP
ncbi:MAG: hypothetical protein JST06_02735 [Bacteroidetes bacterium]|nr:hypothetical protein [Bacteroidota bacterium]MBS1630686.1 hypothetical protein [Bacteroidota bacterium]